MPTTGVKVVRDAAALSRRGDGGVLARAPHAEALQAEQALDTGPALAAHRKAPAARPALVHRPQPDEPERGAEPRLELCVEDVSGVVHDPLRDRFRLSRDPAVNYMLFATRG